MTVKSQVPQIRFKGFSREWEEKKLAEISTSFEYGLNVAATNYDGIHKYLRITDIDETSHVFNMNNLTSPNTDLNLAENYRLNLGDILFARTGASVGKTYIYKEKDGLVYYAGFLIRARIKRSVNAEFIFQNTLTKKYNKFIQLTSQRSGQPGVNANEYSNFEVVIPKFDEQIKIGNYFQNLDKLIVQKEKKYQKLKQLKKAMIGKMFPKGGEDIPEIRFKGFIGKWEEEKLGNVGKTYTGLSGKTKEDFGHGDGKFVTYMNVFSNSISKPNFTEPIEIDKNQNEVKFGDVFFTTSSETPEEVGMTSLWMDKDDNVYLNSFCFGYRSEKVFDNYYLAYMLRSFSVRKKIIFLAQGISRYNISKNKVMEIFIPIPDIKEQTKIGNYFKKLDKLIDLQQKELEKLKNIKKASLEKMFV